MKLFLYLPIFVIVLIGNAQNSKFCSFGHNFLETEQYTLSPLKKENIKTIDSLLGTIGVERNFHLYHSNTIEKISSFAIMNSKKNRYIDIPTHLIDSLSSWENINIHNLSLLHAIGHHVNNHELRLDSDVENMELIADQYLGYFISKLGLSIDHYINLLNNALPEQLYTYQDPRADQRIKAFTKGWNMFIEEKKLLNNNNSLTLFIANNSKSDSLLTQAKENVTFDAKLSESSYLMAYQYSNGSNLRSLYNAFTIYYKANKYDSAILCGNELIRQGAGFLNSENYITFLQNLGQSYKSIYDYKNALSILEYGQKLAPLNAKFPYTLSGIYRIQGMQYKCIESLIQTIKIGPATVDLYFELAESYNDADEPLEAIKYYKGILSLNPKHINARIELANTYIKEGKELLKQIDKADYNSQENRKIFEIKKELWANAENVLKEGLEHNRKNNILNTELEKLKNLQLIE